MHLITTVVIINGVATPEFAHFEFANQEEVIDFLNDYESMELDKLYALLRKEGDRTTAYVKKHHRKAMTRIIEGTARTDGHEPVEGSIVVTVERVA